MSVDKQPPRDTWQEAIELARELARKLPEREAES